jgi:hypothetical protein
MAVVFSEDWESGDLKAVYETAGWADVGGSTVDSGDTKRTTDPQAGTYHFRAKYSTKFASPTDQFSLTGGSLVSYIKTAGNNWSNATENLRLYEIRDGAVVVAFIIPTTNDSSSSTLSLYYRNDSGVLTLAGTTSSSVSTGTYAKLYLEWDTASASANLTVKIDDVSEISSAVTTDSAYTIDRIVLGGAVITGGGGKYVRYDEVVVESIEVAGAPTYAQSAAATNIGDDYTINIFNNDVLSAQYDRTGSAQVPFILGTPGPISLRSRSSAPIIDIGKKKT